LLDFVQVALGVDDETGISVYGNDDFGNTNHASYSTNADCMGTIGGVE
jgi:hypothetical protein